MDTVKDFFASEIDRVDRSIKQVQEGIDDILFANGRPPDDQTAMHAMLDIKCRQRRILEEMAAQSRDFQGALALCRLRLIAAEQAHARIAARQSTRNLAREDAWWDSLNDIKFLAHLSCRLVEVLSRQKPRTDYHNGRG